MSWILLDPPTNQAPAPGTWCDSTECSECVCVSVSVHHTGWTDNSACVSRHLVSKWHPPLKLRRNFVSAADTFGSRVSLYSCQRLLDKVVFFLEEGLNGMTQLTALKMATCAVTSKLAARSNLSRGLPNCCNCEKRGDNCDGKCHNKREGGRGARVFQSNDALRTWECCFLSECPVPPRPTSS